MHRIRPPRAAPTVSHTPLHAREGRGFFHISRLEFRRATACAAANADDMDAAVRGQALCEIFRQSTRMQRTCKSIGSAHQVARIRGCGARVKEAEPKLDTARRHEMYILRLRAATSVHMPDGDVERWRKAGDCSR